MPLANLSISAQTVSLPLYRTPEWSNLAICRIIRIKKFFFIAAKCLFNYKAMFVHGLLVETSELRFVNGLAARAPCLTE